ncbi:hypothetical protein AG1IA_10447 [Rhizoctonia solani AG-1 IA]|uniref:Uncharacterized protein n=1 Tax=Thanatephorus cucumeris (strain AG1-IA) TaxID=983506 RepID=L8WFG0_THACA|nr:hypothetical protein AG1IA_10447 [Rhizoctonia solani AG-1 IA]
MMYWSSASSADAPIRVSRRVNDVGPVHEHLISACHRTVQTRREPYYQDRVDLWRTFQSRSWARVFELLRV